VGSHSTVLLTVWSQTVELRPPFTAGMQRLLMTQASVNAVRDGEMADYAYANPPYGLDLVPENPTDKIANRYSIKEFFVALRPVCN